MKKNIISLFNYMMLTLLFGSVGGGLLASCDMDVQPQGAIPDTETLVNVSDYEDFNNGLYALMRSITSGDYVVLSDVQLDDFNAVIGNGNRRMEFYNGQVQPSTGEIGAIFSGYYSAIAQTNFFIQNVTEKMKETTLVPSDLNNIKRWAGQAYFFRAYCYSGLADKFCQSYKNSTNRDAEGTGLSLQLVYAPTADNTTYLGRSSLTNTYGQIVADLTAAISLLTEYEKEGDAPVSDNKYVSSDAAKALLARVYLNMGMDQEAAELAMELINSKRYELISQKRAFHEMWFRDSGTEIIWKVGAEYSYHGSPTGDAFCNNEQNPDYVPNNAAVYLFEENDTRWYAWFDNDINENISAKEKNITNSGGTASMFLFAKYPGNPILQPNGASGSNFINMGKPLRIGEIYLIAAEAYANLGDEAKAKEQLAALEKARSTGHNINKLSGTNLIEELYDERHRELMGEGLRQADLKRWNIGFVRSDAYDGQNSIIISNYRNIQYNAGDYRLTWPIPQHEIDSNPQVAKQQNPGY